MSETKTVNLSLLDKSLDDIEDLAGFAVPPNGMYTLNFFTTTKVVNDKDTVEASFEVIEVLELNHPEEAEDPATKPGTKFSTLFFLENAIALSRLKEMLTPVANHFGEGNLLVLVTETCKEPLVVSAKVKRRIDKKDKSDDPKVYADVSDITIA